VTPSPSPATPEPRSAADAEGAWGLDLADGPLRAVQLVDDQGQLVVRAFERVDCGPVADRWGFQGPNPAKRLEEMRPALTELARRRRIGRARLVVGYPALEVLVKTLEARGADPRADVEAKASDLFPFPIADMSFGVQPVGPPSPTGTPVVVFAAQRARVALLTAELKAHGLEASALAPSPVAVANLVASSAGQDELVVAIDMGRDHADVVIVDGPRFWSKAMRISGHDMAEKLAKYVGTSSDSAEAFLWGGSALPAPKLYTGIEPALLDLVADSFRAYGFYGGAVFPTEKKARRAIVLGDASRPACVRARFELSYGLPVSQLKSLDPAFKLGADVDAKAFERELPALGPAIGLALQGLGRSRWSLDLSPR
jgi:Tfp pilus assembly PilM family ATPase